MSAFTFIEEPRLGKKQVQLDTVVTVESCYYYVSLLHSFYELEQSMSPEDLVLFTVAAEKRYIDFIRSCHTENSWDGSSAVPLDIAYAWHAHLLSPFRYYEDIEYGLINEASEPLKWTDNFPLKAMHLQRRSSWSDTWVSPWIITKEDLQALHHVRWQDHHQVIYPQIDPAQLPITMRKKENPPYLLCNWCNEELFFDSWGEFAEFRTNPNVVLRCPSYRCSKKSNNVEIYAVSQLLSSLPLKVKGTLLNADGSKKTHDIYETELRDTLAREIESQKESIYTIEDVCDIMSSTIIEESFHNDLDNGRLKRLTSEAKELSNIIRSTYKGNPTGLSLDLVQAMVRQRDFIRTVATKLSSVWKDPPTNHVFPNVIKEYHDFLLLFKNLQSENAIHPTPLVDLAWHVHMLHPSRYYKMTMKNLGRLLNHDDVISPYRFEQHIDATEAAWRNVPLSLFDRGFISKASHSAYDLLQAQKYVYDALQTKLINQRRWRRMPGRTMFGVSSKKIEKEGVSYHGFVNQKLFDQNSVFSKTLYGERYTDEYQEVFESIEHTGYGFIGSITGQVKLADGVERKTIIGGTCPPEAPAEYQILRITGRIPYGSTIVLANGQLNTKYSGFQSSYPFPRLKSDKYQWWMPQYHHYGAMRRKYSKQNNRWGWTSNGFDWYSEDQCCFRVSFDGRFDGKDFIVPRYLAHDSYRYKNGILGNTSIVGGTCVSKTYYGDRHSWLNTQWLKGGFIEDRESSNLAPYLEKHLVAATTS